MDTGQQQKLGIICLGKTSFICGYLLIFQIAFGFGQPNPNQIKMPYVAPTTPEASSLVKHINFPVSYNTGLPSISIPLYEVVAGDITLPIYLSYHAGGNKVAEKGGPAGLGWTLHMNPAIVRKVNGTNDEGGYLQNNNLAVLNGSNPTLIYTYKQNIQEGTGNTDEQPDDFYYTLIGSSGRFNYRKACYSCPTGYTFSTFPYTQNSIVRTGDMEFLVKDESGVSYRFGRSLAGASAVENSTDGVSMVSKATEIISPSSRDTIFFEYEAISVAYSQSAGRNDYVSLEHRGGFSEGATNPIGCSLPATLPVLKEGLTGLENMSFITNVLSGGGINTAWCSFQPIAAPGQAILNPKRLKTIRFPSGRVEISGTVNRIASITVYNAENIVIRTISFDTEAYHLESGKYLLKGITTLSGAEQMEYKFDYYGGFGISSVDSHYDHWGYYNGNGTGGTSSSSVLSFSTFLEGFAPNGQVSFLRHDKEPSLDATRNGVLRSITYPTRGKTEFEYELNKYMDGSTLRNAGGLRVATITDYENNTQKGLKRTFKYGPGENGAGTIKHVPSADDYMVERHKVYYNTWGVGVDHAPAVAYRKLRTWHGNNLIDLFFEGGGAVMYGEVAEYLAHPTATAENNGKTIYKYNVSPMEGRPISYSEGLLALDYKNDSWMFGELTEKMLYRKSGALYLPVEKTSYSYLRRSYSSKGVFVGKHAAKNILVRGATQFPSDYADQLDIRYLHYEDIPGIRLLEEEEATEYVGSSSFTKTRNYLYENMTHNFVTRQVDHLEEGTLTYVYRYPQDCGVEALYSRNIFTPIIESRQIRDKGAGPAIVNSVLSLYRIENGLALQDQVFKLNLVSPLSSLAYYHAAVPVDSRYEREQHYVSYSTRGNLVAYKDQGAQVDNAILWGYAGQHVVANVSNSLHSDVAYAGFDSDGKGNWSYSGATVVDATSPTGRRAYNLGGGSLSKGGLVAGRRYLLTYWAKSGSAGSISGGTAAVMRTHNGWTLYWRLVTGVSSVTLSGSVRVDDVRLHPVGATMDTYTYDPLVGMTSHTDGSGYTRYYEYDTLGRLKAVRNLEGHLVEDYKYNYRD